LPAESEAPTTKKRASGGSRKRKVSNVEIDDSKFTPTSKKPRGKKGAAKEEEPPVAVPVPAPKEETPVSNGVSPNKHAGGISALAAAAAVVSNEMNAPLPSFSKAHDDDDDDADQWNDDDDE
jgi:hypothetical protein